MIEKIAYIYLDSIFNHLFTKLNTLAIIHASIKTLENEKYYRYYKINIYKLKEIEIFLNLLRNDTIKIELISRINKSGKDIGRYRNKNLVFSIKKYDIEKLFKKIYSYDYDKYKNFQII